MAKVPIQCVGWVGCYSSRDYKLVHAHDHELGQVMLLVIPLLKNNGNEVAEHSGSVGESQVFVSDIKVQNLFETLTHEALPIRFEHSDKDLFTVIASSTSTSASTSSSDNYN